RRAVLRRGTAHGRGGGGGSPRARSLPRRGGGSPDRGLRLRRAARGPRLLRAPLRPARPTGPRPRTSPRGSRGGTAAWGRLSRGRPPGGRSAPRALSVLRSPRLSRGGLRALPPRAEPEPALSLRDLAQVPHRRLKEPTTEVRPASHW